MSSRSKLTRDSSLGGPQRREDGGARQWEPSNHQIPTIDVDGSPGDVAGFCGGQESDQVSHLAGAAEAGDREAGSVVFESVRGHVALDHLGIEQPWADRVDGNAEGSQLLGAGAGQAEDPGLRGRV